MYIYKFIYNELYFEFLEKFRMCVSRIFFYFQFIGRKNIYSWFQMTNLFEKSLEDFSLQTNYTKSI